MEVSMGVRMAFKADLAKAEATVESLACPDARRREAVALL